MPLVSHLFWKTATMVEGGLARSSNASRRMKSKAMSYRFIHATCNVYIHVHNIIISVTYKIMQAFCNVPFEQ